MERIANYEQAREQFSRIVSQHALRPGMKDLMSYLNDETDFQEAPCSTQHHLALRGGLLQHSLHVYAVLDLLNIDHALGYSAQTVATVALFHDVCKVNTYKEGFRWSKDSGKWEKVPTWKVEEHLPLGHGEKSVYILSRFLNLSDDEALAIRWHMGAFEPGVHFPYPTGYSFQAAQSKCPLVSALHIADMIATNLAERNSQAEAGKE